MKRASDWIPVIIVAILIAMPSVWAYARISTCGWKGLFVECRIVECAK
jgi:hypothetical protein